MWSNHRSNYTNYKMNVYSNKNRYEVWYLKPATRNSLERSDYFIVIILITW